MRNALAQVGFALALVMLLAGTSTAGGFRSFACAPCLQPAIHPKPVIKRHVVHAPKVAKIIPNATDNSISYTYHISYAVPPNPQGSTVYGYQAGYREVADIYGNIDLGALYAASQRTLEESRRLYSQATAGHQASLDALAQDVATAQRAQAAIAKLHAAGDALSKVLDQSDKDQVRIYREHGAAQDGSAQDGVAAGQQSQVAPQAEHSISDVATIFKQRCGTCHSAAKKEGGLDLTDLSAITAEQGRSIIDRLTTADPKRRMPKKGNLPFAELNAILQEAYRPPPGADSQQ